MPLTLFTGRDNTDAEDWGGAASIRCTAEDCPCQETDLRDPLPGQPGKNSRKSEGD